MDAVKSCRCGLPAAFWFKNKVDRFRALCQDHMEELRAVQKFAIGKEGIWEPCSLEEAVAIFVMES